MFGGDEHCSMPSAFARPPMANTSPDLRHQTRPQEVCDARFLLLLPSSAALPYKELLTTLH